MDQKPSIGRIVHYVSYGTPGGEYGQECRAAVINFVADSLEDGTAIVRLTVFNPEGLFFTKELPYSEEQKGGTWHWPERV